MHRSSRKAFGAAVVGLSSFLAYQAQAAIFYNPVVTMVGDGTSNSADGRTTTIEIFANTTPAQASPLSSQAYNSGVSGTRLVTSITATSEGLLSNNPGVIDAAAAGAPFAGNAYVLSAGFDAQNQTANVNTSATNANRVVGYMNVNGSVVSGANIPVSQTQATAYSNNDIRSGTGDDSVTNFWAAGFGVPARAGFRHMNDNVQVTANPTNVRSVEIHNGQLFGTAGASTFFGIYAIGSGVPTGSGNTSTNTLNTTSSSSPYEFVLVDDPANAANTSTTYGFDTAYIADDSLGIGGIQKWVWNGSAWGYQYSLTDGVAGNRGLAGQLDLASGKTVLWTTSADGTKLYQVTDTGFNASFITLATAPTNNVFRGVALAPVSVINIPEPMSFSIASLLLPLLAGRRRRA